MSVVAARSEQDNLPGETDFASPDFLSLVKVLARKYYFLIIPVLLAACGGGSEQTPTVCNGSLHTVASGEYASLIAEENNLSLQELIDANRALQDNPDLISVGETLCIPLDPEGTEAATATEDPTRTESIVPPTSTQESRETLPDGTVMTYDDQRYLIVEKEIPFEIIAKILAVLIILFGVNVVRGWLQRLGQE